MKIIPAVEVVRRLNKIYEQIPSFECKHCHKCSNPILWFKPEEINIRKYLKKNHLTYLTFSDEEFKENQMRCPYLQKNRCSIYPVRPIVCRLQGTIKELHCPNNKTPLLTETQYKKIIDELNNLNRSINGMGGYYGTRKGVNSDYLRFEKEKRLNKQELI
ncbi:MAG: YkgJ family cysteine cluster protein [Candidatus Thermoplasmatota archaeon]|nr:YkgJ family cysteine cluster protein [Candidatus Thermoplasmatota archaeon]